MLKGKKVKENFLKAVNVMALTGLIASGFLVSSGGHKAYADTIVGTNKGQDVYKDEQSGNLYKINWITEMVTEYREVTTVVPETKYRDVEQTITTTEYKTETRTRYDTEYYTVTVPDYETRYRDVQYSTTSYRTEYRTETYQEPVTRTIQVPRTVTYMETYNCGRYIQTVCTRPATKTVYDYRQVTEYVTKTRQVAVEVPYTTYYTVSEPYQVQVGSHEETRSRTVPVNYTVEVPYTTTKTITVQEPYTVMTTKTVQEPYDVIVRRTEKVDYTPELLVNSETAINLQDSPEEYKGKTPNQVQSLLLEKLKNHQYDHEVKQQIQQQKANGTLRLNQDNKFNAWIDEWLNRGMADNGSSKK
ncbi:hypothetical protein JK635_08105 [Neobacillus sp. YIM B02564]|uniref:Uncharacterized protein n=1 Tax=Neobacillus paridis TaxID=2803862 RepID=A0ABS1TME2_9BACI|nr:hypothetical protein [Neobacillus paridis]MBL4952174.1 hypothetical protein [Neobacillus paridis]